jgi:secreted trypsin-like serine protease
LRRRGPNAADRAIELAHGLLRWRDARSELGRDHPGFAQGLGNDLAVLTLSEPTSAPPIELATPEQDKAYTRPGTVLSVAGFGRRNPSVRGKPRVGLLTTAQVFAHGYCPLPTWAICNAGGRSGLVAVRKIKGRVKKRSVNKVVCSGDSGGPLVANTPEGPRLVGVAEAGSRPSRRSAFGFVRCGLKGYPSIHTRVTEYLDFLEPNLGP